MPNQNGRKTLNMGTLFETIRQKVTARQAADLYGLPVNRYGKALCPWHNDKNPSLSFDKRTGRCKCFSCNAGGGAVDLAAALLHISPLEAAKRIDADFSLHCEDAQNKPPSPKGEISQTHYKREEESKQYSVLCDKQHILRNILAKYTPETSENSDEFWTALQELAKVQTELLMMED